MVQRSSGAEDVFVREMILHGRPLRAAQAAFPLMEPAFLQETVMYMMDDPNVRRRIDAGILYYYRDFFPCIDIPEIVSPTTQEQHELLYKIITGKRKYPSYVKTNHGLSMIMTDPEPAIVNDALYMETMLTEMENGRMSVVL